MQYLAMYGTIISYVCVYSSGYAYDVVLVWCWYGSAVGLVWYGLVWPGPHGLVVWYGMVCPAFSILL